MAIFYNRRPRGYHHVLIYSDERKDKLKEMEERAKRELGIASVETRSEKFRGVFVDSTKHLRRYKERSCKSHYTVLIVLIMLLFLFMYFLLTSDLFI